VPLVIAFQQVGTSSTERAPLLTSTARSTAEPWCGWPWAPRVNTSLPRTGLARRPAGAGRLDAALEGWSTPRGHRSAETRSSAGLVRPSTPAPGRPRRESSRASCSPTPAVHPRPPTFVLFTTGKPRGVVPCGSSSADLSARTSASPAAPWHVQQRPAAKRREAAADLPSVVEVPEPLGEGPRNRCTWAVTLPQGSPGFRGRLARELTRLPQRPAQVHRHRHSELVRARHVPSSRTRGASAPRLQARS